MEYFDRIVSCDGSRRQSAGAVPAETWTAAKMRRPQPWTKGARLSLSMKKDSGASSWESPFWKR